MRFTVVVAILVCSAPPLFSQSAPGVFRAGTNIVVLQVTVTATGGRRVSGLTAEDFTIFEDGKPQQLAMFSEAREPLALALMIDASSSMDDNLDMAQSAAIEFARKLRPIDHTQVLAFNERVNVIQPFLPYAPDLDTAVRQMTARGTTALYQALYVALKGFDDARPASGEIRRHAIILLSDGEDTSSVVGFEEAFDLARRSDVSIYTVGLGMRSAANPRQLSPGAFVLRQFAQTTGGRAIFVDRAEDLVPVYGQFADELAAQYTLVYTPPTTHRDGKWHNITVRINREHCTARTRQGYLASQ
jgi:Ca-activated chloride channel family protein